MKGLKTSTLKRKQQNIRVSKYVLTPLEEDNAMESRDRILVENYKSACVAAARGRDVPHTFKLEDPKYALLKHLQPSDSSALLPNTGLELSKDLLVGNCDDDFFYPERFLLPFINTVVDNLPSHLDDVMPFDVLEITAKADYLLQPRFVNVFDAVLSEDALKLTYTILTKEPEKVPPTVAEHVKQVYYWSHEAYGVAPGSQDMIIYRQAIDDDIAEVVPKLNSLLKKSGFLLHIGLDSSVIPTEIIAAVPDLKSNLNTSNILSTAQASGFITIGKKSLLSNSVKLRGHLYRKTTKKSAHPDDARVVEIGVCDYDEWFESLKLYLREASESNDKRIWLVSRQNAQQHVSQVSGIVGFAKSLRLEEGGERVRYIIDSTSVGPIDISALKYREVLDRDLVHNVFDTKTGRWGSYEQQAFEHDDQSSRKETSYSYLKALRQGDMSSLTWVESDVLQRKSTSNRIIDVHYSALNFRDIMFASGKLDSEAIPGIHPDVAHDSILGLEYSGVDSGSGQRVMGITPFKGTASAVLVSKDEEDFVWPVPDNWTLEEATTVPVVYATALYALLIRGRLAEGESVLIHSACGGVGLAALNICLSRKCKVFATVGSPAKKMFLEKQYPQLCGQIFNSRELTFESDVLTATSGHGVDIVLNSLAEEKLQASLRCLAANGRFLEIGKVDFISNNSLYTHQLNANQSFHGVLLDALFKYSKNTYLPTRLLNEKKQLRQLLLDGIKDGTVKPLDRTVFDHNHVEEAFRFMSSGKHIGKVLIQMRESQSTGIVNALKATHCNPNKSYIVLGGSGGFGLEVVQWLAGKGARQIVISSRRGLREPYQFYAIGRLKKKGVNIIMSSKDITTEDGCRQLITEAEAIGPVGGIFNAAVVYKDSLYDTQPMSQFQEVCGPKSEASLHMDKLTRTSCPQLDYFVTWSSLSCSRGNLGQTNYSFANALMDSICEKRREDGLPGLSIQWGVVGDVGIVADSSNSNDMILLGSQAQRMHSCLDTMDKCLQTSASIVLSYVKAEKGTIDASGNETIDILSVITRLLGLMDVSHIDPETTLGGLGVDSLIAVEIKQALDKTLDTPTSVKEVRDLTISRLIQISSTQFSKPEVKPTPASE